ncbi:hypothetical protein G5V58_16360 [Nocardioides anomalus]|uniref:Uncharacterized protein n=1 Tax=Nocardioides anomalus TaxID=2712223 RepID=A0A6G6WG00_9ACTN|nr:hypothetical protein [Nocardioides anomalus]QIG44136.1 hypothetical protein G5V58_16360 [Nocardioides anomalus]
MKLSNFGDKLGVTRQQGYAIIWDTNMKDDDRAYFCKKNASGSVVYQGLSARALELGRSWLADSSNDLVDVTVRYNRRNSTAS